MITGKETIIVTGGLGFIGSRFLKLLAERKHEGWVVNVDKMTYAAGSDNVDPHFRHYSLFKADIASVEMRNVFDEVCPELVVNFAAESHVDRSIDDPSVFADSNYMGVRNLLELCRKHKCVKRFVQISTDECYGDIALDAAPVPETAPIRPSSPYSATKAGADLLALSYVRTYGLNVVITRCSNNYGPNQHPEKFIPKAITNLLSGEKIPVYAQGTNIRDWIHVDDHCRGIMAALDKGKAGEAYNFGASCELMNIDVVKSILFLMKKSSRDLKDNVEFVGDRPGHDLRYAIDWSKSRHELGWRPEIVFHAGVRDTIYWYEQNLEWWKKRKETKKT
jgi:dTDP-glucose 4,6-dehydratase